ncbi:MAG: hypothetical protein LC664_08315, partial [Flavobacteriales bacterium]|nr:hypothetical protein [Flavobacteriales bacterium]
ETCQVTLQKQMAGFIENQIRDTNSITLWRHGDLCAPPPFGGAKASRALRVPDTHSAFHAECAKFIAECAEPKAAHFFFHHQFAYPDLTGFQEPVRSRNFKAIGAL